MQIAHYWITVINNLLNTKDVVIQYKYKTTHIYYEEYRETRTQKNIQYYENLFYQE